MRLAVNRILEIMKKILLLLVLTLFVFLSKAQSPFQLTVCGTISSPFSGVYTNTITMTIAQGGLINTYTTSLNGSPQFCFPAVPISANASNMGLYAITLAVDSCAPVISEVDTIMGSYSPFYQLQLCNNPCLASITNSSTPNGGITLTANPNGNGVYTYLWSNGATTQTISATSNGTYSVAITDQYGNTCSASTLVSLCSVSINSSPSNLGSNYTNLTAVATGVQPISYLWNNNQTGMSITGNSGANYCVYISDANGCTASVCDTAFAQCTASIGLQGNTLYASSTGLWPFNYSWSLNGNVLAAGTQSLVISQPGLYSCTVLDNNGCYNTAYYNVTNCNLLSATSSISSISNPNGGYTLTANVNGGTAPYIYSWSNQSTAPSTTVLGPGTYCVNITDATGCAITLCDTVGASCSLAVSLSLSTAGGGALIASANSTVNIASYSWTLNGIVYPSNASYLFLSQTGLYCVTVVDANGCSGTQCINYTGTGCNLTASLASYVPPNVPPNTVLGLSAIANGGTAPYYYQWYLNGVLLADSTQNINAYQTGLYTVNIVDINGCSANDTMQVNLSGPGNCSVTITDTITWNTHILIANSSGVWPFTYSWIYNNTFIDTTSSIIVQASGNYTVTITDASGCANSYTYYVSQGCIDNTSYSIPINGGPVVINASSNGVPPFTYTWTLNGLPFTTQVNQSSVTTTIDGVYCYTITDANNCTVSNCYTYNSSPIGGCDAYFTTAFDSLYLPNSNNILVDFTSYPNGMPPFTYNWVFSDGSTSNLANPQHMFYYSNYADMMWAWASLSITDATGCTSTYNNSVPLPPVNYGCAALFASQSYYSSNTPGLVQFTNLSSSQDTSSTYFWTFSDSTYSYDQNPNHVFQTSGLYYVCLTVTNSYGCTASYCESIYIDLNWWNNNPYNTGCTAGYILVPNGVAPGTVLVVDVSQVNNASYVWSANNGFITNAPNPFFNLNGPGTFTLCATVTDTLTGCSDTFCDSLSIDSLGNVFKVGSNVFLTSNATVGFVVVSSPRNASTTGINESKSNAGFKIWPNPANNVVEITMNPNHETSNLSIYDIAGSLVLEQKINANTSILKTDISSLSNGSYLIKLSDSKNSSISKLIVNH